MTYRWVIGRFPYDGQGAFVLASANAGIGYFIMNRDRQKRDDVIAAFKMPNDTELPVYIEEANQYQIEKLEKASRKRSGIPTKSHTGTKSVSEIFAGSKPYALKEAI